jgi:hypothetical protein
MRLRCESFGLLVVGRQVVLTLAIVTSLAGLQRDLHASDPKADEELIFFPGIAHADPDGAGWVISVEGCVYEPESRWAGLAILRGALRAKGVALDQDEEAFLAERARLFMADQERRKKVSISFGEHQFTFPRTAAGGWLRGTFRLTSDEVKALAIGGSHGVSRLVFSACLPHRDGRVFPGSVFALPENGLLVVSDIDDTIKVTEVGDNRTVLRNTFLRSFAPVPGIAALYSELARQPGCHFAYVSASPWQLFPPLSEFVQRNGFPEGTFHLREFRWTRRSLLDLKVPDEHKQARIQELLDFFPKRKFLLIGDSGEHDPEIYGAFARQRRSQIAMILIRGVRGTMTRERCATAFRDLPVSQWTVFETPAEASVALRNAGLIR